MATAAKKTAAKKTAAKKTAAKKTAGTSGEAFTAEEKAAMKEAARERRAQKAGSDGLADVLAKIAAMADDDREIAERVHALVLAAAPDLEVRTWYGMPAYAKDGKVVCFFQDAAKFKARYCTLGFQDPARLDEGSMWATSFAITAVTRADEKRITDLVRRAVR
jgi:hypothetical protein